MKDESQDELVTVYIGSDAVDLAFAKSILDKARILYYAKGEGLQNIIGYGTMGLGYNPVVGPVEIQVIETNASEARDLLADRPGIVEPRAEVGPEITARQEAVMEKWDLLKRRLGIGLVSVFFVFLACCMIYQLVQTLRHAP